MESHQEDERNGSKRTSARGAPPRHGHPEVTRARLVVDNPDGNDRMTLLVEVPGNASSHADSIVTSIREITKLRGEVEFRMPGELPNDGKVIEDVRKYD